MAKRKWTYVDFVDFDVIQYGNGAGRKFKRQSTVASAQHLCNHQTSCDMYLPDLHIDTLKIKARNPCILGCKPTTDSDGSVALATLIM
jgi:hypothetical protein